MYALHSYFFGPQLTLVAIETTQLDVVDLNQLVAKTRVVVNTIGPFSRFSSPIVEACAKHGIHYVDT